LKTREGLFDRAAIRPSTAVAVGTDVDLGAGASEEAQGCYRSSTVSIWRQVEL